MQYNSMSNRPGKVYMKNGIAMIYTLYINTLYVPDGNMTAQRHILGCCGIIVNTWI